MNKLKLIKVPGNPTSNDLEFWRDKFQAGAVNNEELQRLGIVIEEIDFDKDCITMIKIGDDKHLPTTQDLENWQEIFKEAEGNPDFKIFTHSAITIEKIKIQDNIFIVGDYKIL